MNKSIMVLILSAAFAAQAKQIENPDANTLWMEDGREIELSRGPAFRKWQANPGKKELEFISKQDGKSFSLLAKDAAGRRTLTRVKLSKEYPYLTFRITGFDLLRGYRNWTLGVTGLMGTSQATATTYSGSSDRFTYRYRKVNACKKPSVNMVSLDNGYKNGYQQRPDSALGWIAFRHGGRYTVNKNTTVGYPNGTSTNCGYLDGHAATEKVDLFKKTTTGSLREQFLIDRSYSASSY